MAPTVAVIGGGPLGISSIKNLTEEGFDCTGFESRSYLGGVWKYNTDEHISVQESTIFNSSRYRSAFTDFPFDDDVDDFPTWRQFSKYINDYADHFDVRRKIQLDTFVESVTREDGRWAVSVKQKDGSLRKEKFDKVVIANGYFTSPRIPKIEGIEEFSGPALHAINFHHPEQYDGKNILLIGLHATTQDVVKMLAGHAKQVYLSHRNGILMVGRYAKNGAVIDAAQTMNVTKVLLFLMEWFPNFYNWAFDKLVNSMSKQSFPTIPASWNFSPAPPVYITNPLVGDDLYPLMQDGWANPIGQVEKFTGPKSVKLKDGTQLEDIDAVIYCTGYDASVPFLKDDLNPYQEPGQQGNLYRNIFLLHPDPAIRDSIAFIGHGGITWPGLSTFELQSAAVAQIWIGKSQLPPFEEMRKWNTDLIAYRKKLLASQPTESTHYPAILPLADQLRWLDRTAGTDVFDHFGWGGKAWRFWWRDRAFYGLCSGGVLSSALWRLFETGKRRAWGGAREQIYRDNEALKRQVEVKRAEGVKVKRN
ncbi:hypothetical protein EG328_008849 [Venturia inaequalis]|uniref:Uncharacterized protein n=1 Tax=Venturia inaequalis TaxID=5025 RepID=A0A8H3VC20_VENIN|nr:hypothetical protein EG328_008849 [Venturia inaequalis]